MKKTTWTKTKNGMLRYGPFKSEDTLNSYLRLHTPPVMITTSKRKWLITTRDSIRSVTKRWKKTSPKSPAYIEVCKKDDAA